MKKGGIKKMAATLAALQAFSLGAHFAPLNNNAIINPTNIVCRSSNSTSVDETGKVIYDTVTEEENEKPKVSFWESNPYLDKANETISDSQRPEDVLYSLSNIYVSYEDPENPIYLRYNPATGEYSPISIFDAENRATAQYGANQNALYDNYYRLIRDEYIWNELQRYFPVSAFTSEEAAKAFYKEYFALIKFCGCGYAAAIDSLFRAYEGKEREFEEMFGYPMYTVDEKGKIDFNYEIAILQFFNYSILNYSEGYGTAEQVINAVTNGTADFGISLTYEFGKIREYLKEYAPEVSLSTFCLQQTRGFRFNADDIVACEDFSLYKETDSGLQYYTLSDLEAHYVYVVGFTEDGRPIISSWGEQYILDNDGANWTYQVTLKLKV